MAGFLSHFLMFFSVVGLSLPALAGSSDFERIKTDYTKSLHSTGLDNILQVHDIKKHEGYYFLELQFNYQTNDSASVAWQELKHKMLVEQGFSAEEFLFYRFWKISNLSPDSIAVYIKDNYVEPPCLFVAVFFDSASRKVQTKESLCLAEIDRSLNLQLTSVSFGGTKMINLPENVRKNAVYSKILHWSKRKYAQNGNYKVNYVKGDDVIEFSVNSIKNEVITEDNIWFCELLNWLYEDEKCDMRPYEYLKFRIEYIPESSVKAKLSIKIDGRYAPVYGKYKEWQYCTPIDLQFSDAFDTYANQIRMEINGLF